uniref:Uncharacterized protein n=1 Tax=Gelidium kathyanniae TaxID=2483893 RepID=A0A3G2QXX9_9FLOR|nr:hypothetical protein [Gelidium kathyanniae]AYO27892.1 hypothetical protein [Gelidium kathyanniae]
MGEISMDNTKNKDEYDDMLQEGVLAMETPVGWSSICLDQTIDYYIECNSVTLNHNDDSKNLSS